MIRLGQTQDKRLMVVSNQDFPSDVRRVEYYRDLRLFMLVYENEEDGSDLMPCEISEDVAQKVVESPDIIVIAMAQENTEPYGYHVPLVQIGV
ncbi:MAG: hypothetical protein HRT94_07295 [Alphaproteobacteria bacterium]|nr:hypothetical protein [Alphaproteobacteria bacterium]